MHTFYYRLNAIFVLTGTHFMVMVAIISLVSYYVQPLYLSTPPQIRVNSVRLARGDEAAHRFYQTYYYRTSHFVEVVADIDIDTSALFKSWNAKLVQLQLRATYVGSEDDVHSVALWDAIVMDPKPATLLGRLAGIGTRSRFSGLDDLSSETAILELGVKLPYAFHAQKYVKSTLIANRPVRLDLVYCIQPYVGFLRHVEAVRLPLVHPAPLPYAPSFSFPLDIFARNAKPNITQTPLINAIAGGTHFVVPAKIGEKQSFDG